METVESICMPCCFSYQYVQPRLIAVVTASLGSAGLFCSKQGSLAGAWFSLLGLVAQGNVPVSNLWLTVVGETPSFGGGPWGCFGC